MKKTERHSSASNSGENSGTRFEGFQRKSMEPVDHWAFLDDIDAPMWVDLASELNSTYQDKDDQWFHTSHLFHQRSSHHLIGCSNSASATNRPSSPKLPPSVSRSRGNHYRSKQWGNEEARVNSSKQHPIKVLTSKSSRLNKSGKISKNKETGRKPEVQASSKAKSVCKSDLTEICDPGCSKSVSSFGDSSFHSNSNADLGGSSSSTSSTITCESNEKQQHKENSTVVSSQLLGRRSALLSSLRVSLRKSCVTRQASRVEINGAARAECRKSSSGKSSIGSNPGYDGKNQTETELLGKDTTPDSSRSVVRMSPGMKNKGRGQVVLKGTNSRSIALKKSTNTEAAKPKVHNNVVNARVARVLAPNTVKTQGSSVKGKLGVGHDKRLVGGGGKENSMGGGRVAESKKPGMREKTVGVVATKRLVPDKIKGGPNQGKNLTKVYLR